MNKNDEKIQYDDYNSPKNKIGGIIFIIWFIISITAVVALAKYNEYYCVMAFGQTFLGFGLIALFSSGSGRWMGIPFVLVGAGCIVVPYLMLNPETISINVNWDKILPLIAVGGFAVIGLIMVLAPIIKTKKLKEICNVPVMATIIDHDSTYGESGKLYCPIYGFEFNGIEYRVSNNEYSNVGVKPIGEVVELKINPNDPEQFLDNSIASKGLMFMGIFWLMFTVPIFIFLLKEYGFIQF